MSAEIQTEFFVQIFLTLIGTFGAIICVILSWYLKKRESCNRLKEELQKHLVKKVNEIAINLNNHIENSKREIQRIDKLEEKVK